MTQQLIEIFFRDLFESLNMSSLSYAVLRNYERLPRAIGHDIDLIVSDDKLFERNISKVATKAGWFLVRTVKRKAQQYMFFLNRTILTAPVIKLDIVSCIQWKGLKIVGNEVLSKRQLYNKLFYILQPGAETSITLIKDLIHTGKVRDKYKRLLPRMVQKDKASFCQALEPCFGIKDAELLADLTEKADWEAMEAMSSHLRWVAILRAVRRHPFLQLQRWGGFLWGHLRQFFRPTGIMVVLLGPDGSGKTTLTQVLQTNLRPLFSEVKYYHGHFEILPRLRHLAERLGLIGTDYKTNKKEGNSKHEIRLSPMRSLTYLFYYSLDYCLGHFSVWYGRRKGQLILFDRYYYDYLIQPGMSLPSSLILRIAQLLPQPDKIIYLKNDPDTIFARKPELTKKELERQSRICSQILGQIPNSFEVVTKGTPEETATQVIQVILSK